MPAVDHHRVGGASALEPSRHQALTEAERADVAAALETCAPGDFPTLMFAAWVLPKPSLSATHMSQTGAGDRRDMKA